MSHGCKKGDTEKREIRTCCKCEQEKDEGPVKDTAWGWE